MNTTLNLNKAEKRIGVFTFSILFSLLSFVLLSLTRDMGRVAELSFGSVVVFILCLGVYVIEIKTFPKTKISVIWIALWVALLHVGVLCVRNLFQNLDIRNDYSFGVSLAIFLIFGALSHFFLSRKPRKLQQNDEQDRNISE